MYSKMLDEFLKEYVYTYRWFGVTLQCLHCCGLAPGHRFVVDMLLTGFVT